MPYAGYLLNPGDMFQVEPDRVMHATGAPKDREQIKAGRETLKKYRRAGKGLDNRIKQKELDQLKAAQDPLSTPVALLPAGKRTPEQVREQRQVDFKDLFIKTQLAVSDNKTKLGAKHKKALRALSRDIRNARARINLKSEEELDNLLKQFTTEFIAIQTENSAPVPALASIPEEERTPTKAEAKRAEYEEKRLAAEERKVEEEEDNELQAAIVRARENPIDETKPYATPWKPRPYMSPFAFIPRYLEVNHNICSAVYLRHPVARPGLAEVPTPFAGDIQQLAFNWYLRRR